MMTTEKKFRWLTGLLMILMLTGANNVYSQMTVGSGTSQQSFSVLELTSNGTKGFRLPQMSEAERDAMEKSAEFQAAKTGTARGLCIFNTTSSCINTWSGSKWIEDCAKEDACVPPTPLAFSVMNRCKGGRIADMPKSDGTYSIVWYDVATGGTPLNDAVLLQHEKRYYAASVSGKNCESLTRAEIKVILGECNAAPTNGLLGTFINVMYDFQHQSIEAYNTDGTATDYKWQVSTDGSNFVDIAGAPNSPFYTIPANFSDRYAPAGYKSVDLWFRCEMSNPTGRTTTPDNLLKIIFIKTTSAGYATGPGGIKYLTLNAGTGANAKKVKIALYNLGANKNNDAGSFGDFYQWGRVADGHEHTNWIKNTDHKNEVIDNGLRKFVNGDVEYDSDGQVKKGNDYYGKFILPGGSSSNDWYYSNGNRNHSLWGNGNDSRQAYNFIWTYPQNNPCSAGWTVPSAYQWWDIFSGTGSDNLPAIKKVDCSKALNNTWERVPSNGDIIQDPFGDVGAVSGGIIITNKDTGEKVFLPAPGIRSTISGVFTNVATLYWTSTAISGANSINAYNVYIHERLTDFGVTPADNINGKITSGCIRPVLVEP